jgi:hypothetical protein
MALVSVNIDAITKDGLWRNVHVGIMLATLGCVACVVPTVWEYCVAGQLLIIGAVWKLKLVLPPRDEKVATGMGNPGAGNQPGSPLTRG